MAGQNLRILLTGAQGFVGRHLTRTLAEAFPAATLLTPATDVRDAVAMAEHVRQAQPDWCIHLAAISSIAMAQHDQDHAWQVNLHGSLTMAHLILRHAPACRLLFVSSADAYGLSFRAGIALTEQALLQPVNIYGATKAAAELALGALAPQGLRTVCLRPFNHIGPGQSESFVVASFARQVARIEAGLQAPVLEVGNIESFRDFLDVRDVCAAYAACLSAGEHVPDGTVLNIASGQPRRVGDILEQLIGHAGIPINLRVDPARMRASDIHLACGDATRARSLLGWAPVVPWDDTLRGVLEDWRGRIAHDGSPQPGAAASPDAPSPAGHA